MCLCAYLYVHKYHALSLGLGVIRANAHYKGGLAKVQLPEGVREIVENTIQFLGIAGLVHSSLSVGT